MAISLLQFARNMNRAADRLPWEINKLKQMVAVAVIDEVIEGTPVDTATARSNWFASLTVPRPGTVKPFFGYPKYSHALGQGRGERPNAVAAKFSARGVIKSSLPGQRIIIQNNVHYIMDLNAGSSAQAPALFVQSGVRSGILALTGKAIRVI